MFKCVGHVGFVYWGGLLSPWRAKDDEVPALYSSLAPPPPWLEWATRQRLGGSSSLRVIFLYSWGAALWRHKTSPLGAVDGGCYHRIEVTWLARWRPGWTKHTKMQWMSVGTFVNYWLREKAMWREWRTTWGDVRLWCSWSPCRCEAETLPRWSWWPYGSSCKQETKHIAETL